MRYAPVTYAAISMADTRKNPQGDKRKDPSPPAPLTKRALSRKRQEEERQRRIILITGVTVGLALLALLSGVLYEQVWLPSRPVAQVNNTVLTSRDYWKERRESLARQIAQNLQLLALFGGQQIGAQFAGQSPQIDQQVAAIKTAPVDEATVSDWQERQLKIQGSRDIGIEVSQDEINQQLVTDLGILFLPPPVSPITPTAALTPTVVLTGTAEAAPAATAAITATAEVTPMPTATSAPTASPTPGGPTATLAPTETPEPTLTPLPTPGAAEAATQLDQIIDALYLRYQLEVEQVGLEPRLTKDDFRAALIEQYREQVLDERIKAQLVPEEAFEVSEDPERIQARQVFVAVDSPADATESQRDQLFNEQKAEADALVVRLRGGADFATVAAEESDDPGSKDEGGDLGFFDEQGVASNGATYPPALVEAAYALEGDAISEPIRSPFGWHILQVTDRSVPDREDQLRDARTEALNEWLEERRTQATVKRFPEPTATPTPEGPTPTEAPTPEPTYLPGPPTPAPTETPVPTEVPAPTSVPTTATVTPGSGTASTPTATAVP